MNFKKKEKTSVDILVILAVFCVFTLTALFVVLFGAKVYQNNLDDIDGSFNQRTSYLYIREKIKNYNTADAISVSRDGSILILTKESEGKAYNTYLFASEGNLYEYTTGAAAAFNPNYGDKILEVADFKINIENNRLLKFTITQTNGDIDEFYIGVVGVKEVANAN